MTRREPPKYGRKQAIYFRAIFHVPQPKKIHAKEPFRPSANAVLLLLCVALGSLWTWLYSDWFATFTGAIGLAAIVGAVPTLKGFMSKARADSYAAWLDEILFQSQRTKRLYVVLLATILFVGFGMYQPVTVRGAPSAAATSIAVTLTREGVPAQSAPLRVEPGKSQRIPVRRPIFGGPDRVTLTARELPVLTRSLSRLAWPEVLYPADFWTTPVVLLHGGPSSLVKLRLKQPDLVLTGTDLQGAQMECTLVTQYLGEPVWIGTGGRILPVSDEWIETWRQQAELYELRRGVDTANPEKSLSDLVKEAPVANERCGATILHTNNLNWKLQPPLSDEDTISIGPITIAETDAYPLHLAIEVSR